MNQIQFKSTILNIKNWTIIRLPKDISELLPSRGMVMAYVKIEDCDFTFPLEPDGELSHWFQLSETICDKLNLHTNDVIELTIEPINEWIEPEVPNDLLEALHLQHLESQWDKITIKARWEWIRWIRFTHNELTRKKRINTACSMLSSGKKRPCCFDQSRCTEPHVFKTGGILDIS